MSDDRHDGGREAAAHISLRTRHALRAALAAAAAEVSAGTLDGAEARLGAALRAMAADARASGIGPAAVARLLDEMLDEALAGSAFSPGTGAAQARALLRERLTAIALRAHLASPGNDGPVLLARRLREQLPARWMACAERTARERRPGAPFRREQWLAHLTPIAHALADAIGAPDHGGGALLAHAAALGAVRHDDGADDYEVRVDFDLLGAEVTGIAVELATERGATADATELVLALDVAARVVARARTVATAAMAVRAARGRAERERRVRAFAGAFAHDVGARAGRIDRALRGDGVVVPGAVPALREARALAELADRARALLHEEVDARAPASDHLHGAARAARRLVADVADAAGVVITLAPDLPNVEVAGPPMELCLALLFERAVLDASARLAREVEVHGCVIVDGAGRPVEVAVEVSARGTRRQEPADGAADLGTRLVQDAVGAIGGRAWFAAGTADMVHGIAFPCRRAADVPEPPGSVCPDGPPYVRRADVPR